MRTFLFLVIVLASVLCAQEGTTVNQIIGPPPSGYTAFNEFSGANLIYTCTAKSVQPSYTASVAAATMTNIVVSANVGTVTWVNHGLAVNNRITVAGGADADLNTIYNVVSVPTADTFTITTASVADGTYTTGLTITTTAPRNTAAIWSVQKTTFSGANPVLYQWANGLSDAVHICANRATLAYQ